MPLVQKCWHADCLNKKASKPQVVIKSEANMLQEKDADNQKAGPDEVSKHFAFTTTENEVEKVNKAFEEDEEKFFIFQNNSNAVWVLLALNLKGAFHIIPVSMRAVFACQPDANIC